MQPNWIVLSLTLAYMAAMGLISFSVRRHARSAGSYYLRRHALSCIPDRLSADVGIHRDRHERRHDTDSLQGRRCRPAWNVLALAVGFVLYAILLAPRFKELGENTISGALAKAYGRPTKLATSVIMIFALQIVAVSTYAGGGTILAGLLNVDRTSAIVITGIVATLYVSVGGMRSVIYTNVLHAVVKYLGILAAVAFGLSQVGGFANLRAHVPEAMFAVDTVGWSQIFAWMVAGIGAVFSTQYVIQAIKYRAGRAHGAAGQLLLCLPARAVRIGAALVGVCAAALLPGIPAIQALPGLIARMDDLLAAIVVAGLAGSLFGTISALSIGAATLLFKDFYHPRRRSEDGTSSLRFVRSMTVLVA